MERGLVLIGRGSVGLLPVVLFSFASRAFGLHAMGNLAIAFALAVGLAEIADFSSQRYVPRLVLASQVAADLQERLGAFHALRLFTLIVGGGFASVALVFLVDSHDLTVGFVVLLFAAWVFVTNTLYASALAENQFALLGVGPLLSLVTAAASAWLILRAMPSAGLLGLAVSLHLSKLCEVAFLIPRLTSSSLGLQRQGLGFAWLNTRYLMFQGFLSSANARLVVPLASALAGAVGAGLLSVGLSFQSIISLFAVAIALPAYRSAVAGPTPESLRAVFRSSRRDWLTALAISALLAVSLWIVSPWLLNRLFRVEGAEATLVVVLIIVSGTFETMSIFAGTFYHACFRDRQLFHLSIATMLTCWIAMTLGATLGGVPGMAWGFLISRILGVLVLYSPLLMPARRPAVPTESQK